MRDPANGDGTRSPSAAVRASAQALVRLSPASKARTTGAQPAACTATRRGGGPSIQPIAPSSAKACHIPTSPVPPPVG